MDGDGEGLVAILQGLDPAGVTLTVFNRSRHSESMRSSRPRIQLNPDNPRPDMPATDQRSHTLPANCATLANQRSSVETSTGADFSRQHTSSQICDGRYASSYKMAHCMVTPTSPPEAVSEFPPQRKEPCRNQGNFEIGGHGSGQWNCHSSGQGSGHSNGKVRVSASKVRHYGGSQTWVEKGSSHRYCKSNRETEAFAQSLRRYPSMAPFRTASTDLIEKLIRYTQAKNFQKMSRSTKSMRSLRQQKSSDTYETAKVSKHQQTYTRRQDDNVVNNSSVQVGHRGRTRNFKLYSPVSDSRNLKLARHGETTYSSSYDYLKAANSPCGRSYRSNESPSPVGSSSPERTSSPARSKSPEVTQSPVRFKSTDGFRSPDRPHRQDRPIRFERSVRDLSLSDMSKYIRSTIRQICNERPVVLQVCPKLKNRLNQHKKICPNKNDKGNDVMEDEPEEDQASGSFLSRLIQSFSGYAESPTEQAGCQCSRPECYCTKATQCVNNPDASTNTITCSCKTPTKTGCCRGMPCVCANKAQDQAYYNKRIDEEISEWLKGVPIHSIEESDSKKRRETVIKELRNSLKQLPDDENFDDNARNEIKSFVDDFPLWNPGKDKEDEKVFKNQLAEKLTESIIGIPRKPDRFRDIVKKWVVNIDFEDDDEDGDKKNIIDNFVNKLKSVAAERPACDIKYTHTLKKEIIELLVELSLKFDGDMVMMKKIASKLATEIVSIPRNVNLLGDTTDLTDEFEENVSDWICEHGLCGELKKDPKLIEGLAKKLNKLKSQGIDDEYVVEKMKEEIHQFMDDVGIAFETMDELIDELMKQLSNTVQTNEMERLNQDELTEVLIDWLSNLPGASDLHPRKFEEIIKELVNGLIEGREQGNEDLTNVILNCLANANLSIDPADLGIHVEELMEKLDILPSNKYHKEQAKESILEDIFDVIENMSIPQDKKAELRNKAEQIVGNHIASSSLNSEEAHDDVKEAIMDDMDGFISSIDLPEESRFKLKTTLSSTLNINFDKSCTRLRLLSRSNLEQTIAKDVRNAVKELPIDMDKKKDLMQKVKGTLSKNMHKPLPSNVKNTINDEISDIVKRCPISEDNSIVGCLKKMLSAVASKRLNIFLPKCVYDIQSKVEKDVGIVIDRSSIDTGKQKELKKSIQHILTENEDQHLSDEVLMTIKKDINGVVSDLSIPQDKKDVLKKTVGQTISEDFNEASSNLSHDLNKIRNKLFEDICNVIEKSPIPRVVKTHLINKLKSMLARNLDSSLSDEEKRIILDEVSNIVKDDMPKEKRTSLTNKLAKKLDTQQRKEDTNEIHQLINTLKKLKNKILNHILRELEQDIEDAKIPQERKIELMKELKDMATTDYKKPAGDIAEAVADGINEIIDELNLQTDKKNELAAALDEYGKLLRKIKDVESEHGKNEKPKEIKITDDYLDNFRKTKQPVEDVDETKAKEKILQGFEKIVEESAIPEEKKMELNRKLKKMATDNLKKHVSDDVRDAIKIGIADILDELQIPKYEKNKLKSALINMTDHYLDIFHEVKQPVEEVDEIKAKESILQGIEKIIEESAIPEVKKVELKRKLKKIATDNLKKPFSDDAQDAIKIGIADILDELHLSESEKNKLKRKLINMIDVYLDNFREAKQPIEDVDETKAKESILQGIKKIIDESAIPEEKKVEAQRKLKKMATDNLKKPFSDDVQDAINIGIADILDELQIPKNEKNKLNRALTNMTDENVTNLRDVDKTKAKESILEGIEKIIEESAIPEEKKVELKRKLKKMATDNLKKPLSDDVQDAIKIGIADILNDLQIPKSEKNKLKSALLNMTDENVANLRDVDNTKAKESILQGIEKIIKESAIPEEKKVEVQRKLKKMATDNLKKPFSYDAQDAIKIGIADILDELQIPKSEKNKLKRKLINMTDENVANLREGKQPVEEVDETQAKESILQGIEKIIEESAIPEEKKMELKRKLKKMATDNLKKPFSDDVQDAIKFGIADILNELQIPKSEKNKLNRALTNMIDENVTNLRDVDKTKAKESILQGIEKITEESAIPAEKKVELERKLKKMATDNLKKPFSDDVQDAIKIGIADILNDLQIPKSEKNKLKSALTNMTDENVTNLRDVDKTKAKESILQGIEKIVEESAIPEEKKMELQRKLKKMATDNLKKPFSYDAQDAIKIGIADILDELQIPKSEKNKLERKLINMTDENVANLREGKQPVEEVDETQAKESILQGIEKIIEESAIPEEKKMELKRKLKKMATDNLKKPFSDDVQDAIKFGIADILNELQIPKSEKNKLNRALTNMIDENVTNLRDVDKTKAKESILQGIEKITEESAIPAEKKVELERKLKKMATDNLKKPFSDDVQDAIKIGIADILNDLQIPKSEKNKLKSALTNMTDENVTNLRDVDKTKAKESILQGIEKITEESAIPAEKKVELERKLKKMATDNLKKPFSDDVQDAIKIGIADILNDLQIPKSEKNKLKSALTNITDENVTNLQAVDKTKAKESILQGIEKIAEESAIPEEKKMELERKLKKMATDNLKKPFSDDVQDAIKIGIADILNDLQIPKSEKNKLKSSLINMTDKNVANLRDVDKTKAKESILQGIEKIVEESAIPEEKKMELQRKLKKMATDNLKKPFSYDAQDAIKIGIADILDELQIPKSEKNKLERKLINMTDENVANLREGKQSVEEVDETQAKESILQGIEKIIEESAIPEEKKMELQRKLKKMATDNLKKSFSYDAQDAIKIGIADTLDELQIPKSEKNKLKRKLINMTDENVANLREGKQPVEEVDETQAKESILQGIEKIIEESAIPEEKKMELKRKLKKMATDKLKKPFSDDVQDAIKIGIADILNELQIPKSEKNKLKHALRNITDENMTKLRETKQPVDEVDETKAKESILQGIEKIIEESAIPEEKKIELKRKLKKMATDNLKKPFSDDVQDAIKIGVADILDELQIPYSEKNKLKRALINLVNENLDNSRVAPPKLSSQVDGFKELESKTKNNILLGLEKAIDEAPVPIDTKKELKKKLKDIGTKNFQKTISDDTAEALKDGMYEILDELNLPKDKKNKLKSELTAAVDENLSNFKNEINLTKSMPDEKRNKLNVIIRRVLPQFDEAVNPSYQKQLAEEFDELLEIAVTDGDFKDARRKLIKKLMREQDLSEKEASAPVDELIGRVQEIALKEDMGDEIYELDPSYVKTLEADFNELVNIALAGGDFKDAKRKLTKKLMREQNLPEEKASACADKLIKKAFKLAVAAQSKDKSLLHKEALIKAINEALDQSTMSKPDKNSLKNKLLSKLKQDLDKKTFINKDDLEPLKSEVLKGLKQIVDASSIPTDKKNELKSLMNEELTNTIDEIMDNYDVEEGYSKTYAKGISKAVNKSPIRNLEKSNLKRELVKTFEGIMDDYDEDKITKHKEAFSKAINDAVDQSTLSNPDKSSLKNKLLNEMKQTVDESPHINNTSALKAEVLQDCKEQVDASSIPIGKKNELKLLLKEEIMDDDDDEETFEMEKSPEYEDKLKKYKEAFARAINHAVDQSTLSKPDKSSQKNKLLSKLNQTIDNSPHLNDIGSLKDEVLKDSKKVVDASSIPIDKKNELKLLLKEEIMDNYNDEETSEIEQSPEYQDKLKKYKEAFARAINHAVDQSTLSKPDKSSQKNKLLSKLNQTIDNSPHLNDIGSLKAEVLKDSKKVVDASSIPIDKKNELKLLLKEEIMDNYNDEETSEIEQSPEYQDKLKKYKEAFARAINHAVDQSTLSKPDKSSQKNKLLSKLNQTIDNSPHLNDIGPLKAEVLKDSKKVVDTSSIPIDKKTELKLLLEETMAETAKELMDDTEVSREALAMFKDKIAETIKTWMDRLPIDLDPKVATAVAKDLASDILDRQKYLQLHPEAISTDTDEIGNLKYQIFRRMKNFVNSENMPLIMEGTEELYRMIMAIVPPTGFPTFRREQSTSERCRTDPVPPDRKKSTSTALSTGNINYSLKELIATSKSIRRQWSRNLDKAITKLPLPRNEKCFLKEKLAIYDQTGQINLLSTKSKDKEETSTVQGTKSKKDVVLKPAHVAPKVAQSAPKAAQSATKAPQKKNKGKPSSRLSKIENAFTFNNTTKQKSPFIPKPNQGVNEKEFTKLTTDAINAWLENVLVNVKPDAKKIIIEELTRDVVDRKKYFQIFGSVELSGSGDLEYLKLQVHRRLNAFVPAEVLKAIIAETKELLAKIDTFKMKVTPESAKKTKSTVSQKPGKKQGNADMNRADIKGKATNTEVLEIETDEEEMEQELSNMEFSPEKTSTPARPNGEPTAEEYKTKVTESIRSWVESMPIDLETEAKTDFIDELTNDIVDRNKYLQVQQDKTISKKEEIENLRFQVFKRLSKANPDASETPDIEKVEELYRMIGDGRRKNLTPKQAEEFKTALNEEISAILDDYNICCDRRELHPSLVNELTKLGKSNADQDEIVENMIETIKRLTYLSACMCDEEVEELAYKLLYRTKKLIARIQENRQNLVGTPVKKKDFKDAMMKDIGDVFYDCPMSERKRRLMESQLAEDYAKDLGIPLEDDDDVTLDETSPESKKGRYGLSFNGLANFIDTALSSIHTDDDTKGEDEIKDMKKNIAYSLIHKIGEMNVDPEIFNDDSLYEAVMRDELQSLLGDITISDDEIQALKEDLIEKVLEAQHRAHEELEGQTYKQNLRDTISKLLPNQRKLSKEEQATMEILKDQLADAFIDLHYSGGNENQRERLKRKIADEINNFCKNYLYRNPCSPLNSRTLNKNLYTALNKVPLPTGDSMRYEVEQARIREQINDWIKELPIQPQNPTEVLARNKLIYVLSKKLFDIEVEGDDTDNELMKKEIVKFLNKMPLESGENNNTLADKLIDKLKASEESRKYDASSNVTIDAYGNVSAASSGSGMNARICPNYKPLATPGPSGSPKVCRRHCPKEPKPFPPCTLSPEDRAHLERIKRRTCLSPRCLSSFMRNTKCDTCVGPRPVDAGSQTVLRPFGMEQQQSPICPVNNDRTPRPCPSQSTNLAYPPCSHARRDPFEIEQPPPSPICSAPHENTTRPCPAGPSRPPPQSGHTMRRHTISSSNIESQGEIQPQIIIKQYYWNPNEKNSIVDESDLQKSRRSSRRQSNLAPCQQPGPAPCQQPGPAPYQQPGTAPCDQTRTSSYAQSSSAPYHSPILSKSQQQNTSPQRIPCDQSFTCPEPKPQQQPSPERYPCWDPQRSFQRPSQRDIPSSRSSCTPSLKQQPSPPCSPRFPKRDYEISPFGLNQQSTPPCSPGFPKRDRECQMPKRNGLQDETPCSSRPCRKEHVIELGSSDDIPNVRPKKRHSDQTDWPYTKFQEDDNFWGVPMRRVILDDGIDESVVMERDQREERIRCRCKERLIPKSSRCQPRAVPSQEIPQGTEDEQNLKRCSKCCGRHCPYPSFLYFKK